MSSSNNNHDFSLLEKKQKQIIESDILPTIGSIWQHYKGDEYIVENFVLKESTEEIQVVYYKKDYKLPISWSRPLSEWNELIFYQDKKVSRFSLTNKKL